MKKILAFLLTIVLLSPPWVFAGRGHGSNSKPNLSQNKSYVPNSEKTVYVHSYIKRDGTHVAAYNRRQPNSVKKVNK
jgi:hypothetical protein